MLVTHEAVLLRTAMYKRLSLPPVPSCITEIFPGSPSGNTGDAFPPK